LVATIKKNSTEDKKKAVLKVQIDCETRVWCLSL